MSRKVFHLAVMVFALFSGFVASAQERTITGVVKDTNGQPLIGVTVLVKGTSRGTATDFDGNFSIQASTGETLAISATGMKSIDVPITSDKSFYEVTMETDVAQLKAVVVTGFDNVEERLFTGANSSITAEELKVDGVVDVSRMLEGKAAGVNVQNVSGTFGAGPKITIRGSSSIFGDTSPLFVVDGVVREDIVNLDFDQLTSGDATTLIGSSIAGINANDIQSIEILKDASATALYGARALNGIVVITTKSGRKESPTTISYTLEQSIRVTPSYSNYDILNSQETMGILKELESKGFLTQAGVVQSEAGGVYYRMYDRINTFNEDTGEFLLENTPEARNRFLQQYEMANTDWFETLFRQSLTQNHSLSFTGGGQNNSYYASVSFYNDPGLTIADEVNRVTTSFKNTFYLSDDFDLTLTGKASKREQRAPGTYAQSDDVVSGEISRNFDINPFSYALNTNRTIRPYDNQGNLEYVWDNYAPFNIINELQNNYIELDVLDALFQVDANWDITDELSYKLTASGRYVKTSNQHIVTEDANAAEAYRSMGTTIIRNSNPFLWSDPEDPTAQPVSVLPYGGIYTKTDNTLESYYLRNTLNYQTKFNNIHDLVVLLGQDLRYVDRTQTFFEGYGMQFKKGYVPNTDPDFFEKYIGEGGQYFGKSLDRIRTVAFFGKATYAYDNRYVFAATGRYDGSNRQGQTSSSRWLPTWSLSGKWSATNEDFLDNPDDVLSNLQLRASYGLTATAGPATNSLAIFRNDIIFRKLISQRENVIFIDELQNTDLTWEKQYELNLGIDLGFFDNRISMRADVYERQGFDLIDFVTTSGIGGQSIKAINNADMTTRGFEFSINSTNIKTEDFSWNTTLNYSMFDQEITKLSDRPNVLDMVDFTGGNVVGFPRNSLFSIDFAGLDDRGLPTFNIPGNNITGINFQDNENIFDYLVYEGPVAPDHSAGFNNTFQYKNWSLNVFISASWGNKIRLDPIYSSSYSDLDVFTGDFLNRWLLPGDENTTNIPVIADRRLLVQTPNLQAAYNAYNYSTERVADGGFVRMKNISLGYDFPKEMVNKLGLSTLSLKVLTTNPFLIYSDDKLNGQDPEFFQAGGVAYPILQQYTLSLNLSL